MKIKHRLCAASLAVCCSAALLLPAFASETEADAPDQAAFFGTSDAQVRGLLLDCNDNRDYPEQPESTAAVLGGNADEIVSFAKQHQFNTLFYEISPRADAAYRSNYLPSSRYITSEEGGFVLTDPLDVLLETADMENLNVVVSLSLLYAGEVGDTFSAESPVILHPDWFITRGSSLYFDPRKEEVQEFWISVLTELVENYNVDGIVLSDLDCFKDIDFVESTQELADRCIDAIHRIEPNMSCGVSVSFAAADQELWRFYISGKSDYINFVIPEMSVSLDADKDYSYYLDLWTSFLRNSGVRLYTMNFASMLRQPLVGAECFGDERELTYQLYANAVEGASGYIVHSYRDLKDLRSIYAEELNLVPDSANSADYKLDYDKQPALSLAVDESMQYTSYREYYLSGRCDPTKPLYINNEPVDPQLISPNGFWGVSVDLERGSNHFVVRQEAESVRVNVYSSIRTPYQTTMIEDIQAASVYPQANEALYEGEMLHLSCVAPYGGSVMAFLQNQTYHLLPPADCSEEDIGKAVEYSLDIYPEYVDSTQTVNLGKVSYILTYKDFSSKYRSEGQLYMVGSGSRLAVEVTDSMGRVYQNIEEDALICNLPSGACDYAAAVEDSDYYRLYSGGYIHKKDVSILEGFVDIQKSIEAVGIQSHDRGENFIFVGGEGLPYYIGFNENSDILTFQLSNLVDIPSSLSHLASKMFDSIQVNNDEEKGSCTIRLHLAEGQELWGYQVEYSEGNLYLKCKTPPTLSSNSSKPLQGISVVLDAGHGGSDQGAMSVWGAQGPMEKDITLAYAQSLRRRLESLGAEVSLTRSDDSTMDEEDRILYSAYKDADLYLSFHGTATESNVNGQAVSGISVYYDNEMSYDLGRLLYRQLASQLKLKNNDLSSNDLSVIKVPLARAVMICPGVLTNPLDYERMTDPVEIYKTTCLISDSLIDYIRMH